MDITLSEDIDAEYLEDVADILTNKEFLALNSYRHHVATTRLMHSINVSYISWLTAKKLGCDAQAAARAGLLHDFFLYDPREGRPSRELQAFCHPKVAARTSGTSSQITGSMDYIRRGQNMRLCGSIPYYDCTGKRRTSGSQPGVRMKVFFPTA